jgi:MFS superfamily sulfate permease-like transporter
MLWIVAGALVLIWLILLLLGKGGFVHTLPIAALAIVVAQAAANRRAVM